MHSPLKNTYRESSVQDPLSICNYHVYAYPQILLIVIYTIDVFNVTTNKTDGRCSDF